MTAELQVLIFINQGKREQVTYSQKRVQVFEDDLTATTPIPVKLGRFANPLHLYAVEYSRKTRYLFFKLTNVIIFVQIYAHFEIDVCNRFQQSWDRFMFPDVLHHLSFNNTQ